MEAEQKKKLVLIDGNSILNRAFYGVPELTNSKGLHTNAIFGFLNILFKLLEEEQAEYIMVAFDRSEPTFRHEMYAAYKGTRKPMPEELYEQMPVLKQILKAMNIQIIEKAGYEADDILGTIAKQAEREGFIISLISGDRDLLQLANETIQIRIPKTKRGKTEVEDYHTTEVIEKYGVTPEQIIDLKGLMGDSSDNIPGVPGIGEKTAAKIIQAFHTVENAYEHRAEITPKKARESLEEHYDLATLSKKLATIKLDCSIEYQLSDARIEELYTQEAYQFIKELEFKSFFSRFEHKAEQNMEMEQSFQVLDCLDQIDPVFQEIILLQKEQTNSEFHIGAQFIIEHNQIIGLSLSYNKHVYYMKAAGFLTGQYYMDKMKELLEQRVIIAVLDLKSQLPFLACKEDAACYDMGVAAYLLNPMKESYSCDDIARDYLGLSIPSYQELFGKKSIGQIAEEMEEEAERYFCYQGYIAYCAYPILKKKLEETENKTLFFTIENPLIYTLYDMEQRGIRVDAEGLKQYGEQLTGKILQLEHEVYELAGEEFNINSPKQLGVILFEKLQLPFAKKTKTGYSTSADILQKLSTESPIIDKILEYRQLTKLKSTYAEGLLHVIQEDSRIHSTFNQTITATGRISSTEPNLQNIPIRMELGRLIRKVFIPEEGYVFLDADYSQIELRVLAHMSKDEQLIEAYKTAQDIHALTASQVFHVPIEEVTSLQRRNAKAVNFGIIYGISSFGLGQDLNITKQEAEQYMEQYFETYPKIKEFLEGLVTFAKEHGYVETLYHRRRPIPELKSSNFMQRSFGERVAMNSPIQGTAADIIKIAMIRVNQKLKEKKLQSRLLLQIHDELLVETKEEEIKEVKQIMEEEMRYAAKLSVPLEVEVKQGNDWYEAK